MIQRRFSAWLLAVALGCGLLPVVGGASAAADRGGAILLVTGDITETNRPPFDPFNDALLNVLGEKFEKARSFTAAELRELPQTEITLRYPNWPRDVTLRGPLLADVLKKVGARGSVVGAQAIDGYAPEFDLSDIEGSPFVLALEADGQPLSIGGHGPIWLVFPPGAADGGASVEDDSNVPWAVFHLKVK